ncbi:MAG: hypothetical protein GTN64_05500 [Candidatus Latescibacteria bacterium]|nr:hypothetical protein [Candidatus Latescibacterota bacterium]NIO78065.1 hypothetical protein [Candidatus Latescibacterota bacterium]
MVNWNDPTTATSYLNVLSELRDRDANIAKMDFTGDTNIPTGFTRFASNLFSQWDGATWNSLTHHFENGVTVKDFGSPANPTAANLLYSTSGELISRNPSGLEWSLNPSWSTFAPGFPKTSAGGMTFTLSGAGLERADAWSFGKLGIFHLRAEGTTSGTADMEINFDLPWTINDNANLFQSWSAIIADAGTAVGMAGARSDVLGQARRGDNLNFGLGTGRIIVVTGIAELA